MGDAASLSHREETRARPVGRGALLAVLVTGGPAVLASYVWGVQAAAGGSGSLWGGVPPWLQPVYVATMLCAAAGFFPFTFLLAFRTDPGRARFAGGRFGFGAIVALYALVLFPSAAWLPLTAAMLSEPGALLWWAIRLDLLAVAAGALGLLVAVATLEPRPGRALRTASLVGALAFCLQTVVLDALVWPALFPR